MKDYQAPWSRLLLLTTFLATVISLAASVIVAVTGHGNMRWFAVVPVVLCCWAACFAIRGYALTSDTLLIRRLFWSTRISIAGIDSVKFVPNAMKGSIRLFGNGGMFSFSGLYRNRELGSYRAFVTDFSSTVVLRFNGKTVLISPANPEAFVREFKF